MNVENNFVKTTCKISRFKLNTSDEELENYIKEIYRLGDSQNRSTNVKGQMTTYQVFNESQVFNNILTKILDTCKLAHEVTVKSYEMVIEEAWGAVYREKDFANAHNHLPSIYSFVYYLNETQNLTPIIFTESDFVHFPHKNDLLFFPSHIRHAVPAHSGNDRVVLAGNMKFVPKEEVDELRNKS